MVIHESGHAVVGLEVGIHIYAVTIVDELGDGAGGSVTTKHPRWLLERLTGRLPAGELRDKRRREVVERYLVQVVGGRAAEKLLLGVARPPHHFWGAAAMDPSSDAGRP